MQTICFHTVWLWWPPAVLKVLTAPSEVVETIEAVSVCNLVCKLTMSVEILLIVSV